ncbi:MAG: hypothetical protein ACPG21_03075 [Crocinitomicaceae bacterium]
MFNTLSILSIVGNVLVAILFAILFLGGLNNSSESLQNFAIDGVVGGFMLLFTVLSALVLISCILSILGVVKMRKGQRRGFKLYAIGNGAWIALVFYASLGDAYYYLISAAISALFILFFLTTYLRME